MKITDAKLHLVAEERGKLLIQTCSSFFSFLSSFSNKSFCLMISFSLACLISCSCSEALSRFSSLSRTSFWRSFSDSLSRSSLKKNQQITNKQGSDMEMKPELSRNSTNLHDRGIEKSSCCKALLYGPNTRKVASIWTAVKGC